MAVDSEFILISLLPLLALENVEYKTNKSHKTSDTTDEASKTWALTTWRFVAGVVTLVSEAGVVKPWPFPVIIFNKLGLHALLLLFDMADQVKYIT